LVVTNIASLTEVVSGKVNFVEPANECDIAQGIINFYNEKYETIADKKFYWKDNIEKTLAIYKDVI